MITRLLPQDEWHRLAHTEVGREWSTIPTSTRVIVVEDDASAIVGAWLVLPIVHVECLWIAEPHRKHTSVARRLWTAMRALVRAEFQAHAVATAAVADEVRALLRRAGGVQIPGEQWVLPLTPKERPICP